VLPGGAAVSNIPIADTGFDYVYYPYKVFLALISANH